MEPAEELKLVTDFEELKSGMVCVFTPCGRCGKRHRFQLLNLVAGFSWTHGFVQAFATAPPSSCMPDPHVAEFTVATGRLYRVVDGLENERPVETAAPRVLERV